MTRKFISKNQINRYPIYLNYLKSLNFSNEDFISNKQISNALNINLEVVKKDLAAISSNKGLPRIGRKVIDLIDDIEKYIWSQMNMFFSAAQTIENIPCYDPSGKLIKSEDLDSSLIFRQISGGTLRLLLESYFRTMYLYSAGPEKEKDRLEDIISSFGFAYNRFIREANKRKDKYDFLLKKLPPKITTIKTKNIDIRRLLQNSVDIEGNTLEHLYTIYSIACLYAHGTIDNFIEFTPPT